MRTRNTEVIRLSDVVVDVGGVYDSSKNRFDHHQVCAPTLTDAVCISHVLEFHTATGMLTPTMDSNPQLEFVGTMRSLHGLPYEAPALCNSTTDHPPFPTPHRSRCLEGIP